MTDILNRGDMVVDIGSGEVLVYMASSCGRRYVRPVGGGTEKALTADSIRKATPAEAVAAIDAHQATHSAASSV